MKAARAFILAIIGLVASGAAATEWSTEVADADGLPLISRGGAPAVAGKLAFWDRNWSWAPMETELRTEGTHEHVIAGRSPVLGLALAGRTRRLGDGRFEWSLEFDADRASEAIGGGIAFKFDLGLAQELGEPELLPDNAGWSWGTGRAKIEMRFVPAAASVYFERGRKDEVRVFFFKDRIRVGKLSHVATLSVPEHFATRPPRSERFRLLEASRWPAIEPDLNSSSVDLSFLNAGEKPAGRRGFVSAKGDALVFEDGTVARFWGTNLSAQAIFSTPKERVRQQARRMSMLGFNLVRLHHHDSHWVVPNVFGGATQGSTRSLNSAMLDRIDWWIKCLKEEGIYVWLDLHVQRALTGADGIENFDEVSGGRPTGEPKGFNYLNRSVAEAMKRFNEAYVTRGNNYTGLRYKDDPAIVAFLITNENDITHHYGHAFLPDKNRPRHHALYMAAARSFAARHRLPADRTWKSWEHGPSRLFLNDLEHRFNAEMIAHLRGLGVKVPIVTTSSWGRSPLSSLPALTDGDMVDVHSYGGAGLLEADPRRAANLLHWIAAAQVVDMPLSVSEWNTEPFPLPERHMLPIAVAAMASHQGWDSLMHYAYSQGPLSGPGAASNWETWNDPAFLATLPPAALIFRRAQVRPATTLRIHAVASEAFFGHAVSAESSAALRSAAELGRLLVAMPKTPELPWLRPSPIPAGATVIGESAATGLPNGASEAVSDTGELRRNWIEGSLEINSPHVQAAVGWIGGKRLRLADVDIEVAGGHASVIVQSRDGLPISASQDIMITATSVVQPSAKDRMPYRRAPVDVRLVLRASPGLRLGAGEGGKNVPMMYRDGRYAMQLGDRDGDVHFRLWQP